MPPFGFQALVRAEARTQEAAQAFLRGAAEAARALAPPEHVAIYSPVPMGIQRVANVERAQMLVESSSRPFLQQFLAAWRRALHGEREKRLSRWGGDEAPRGE